MRTKLPCEVIPAIHAMMALVLVIAPIEGIELPCLESFISLFYSHQKNLFAKILFFLQSNTHSITFSSRTILPPTLSSMWRGQHHRATATASLYAAAPAAATPAVQPVHPVQPIRGRVPLCRGSCRGHPLPSIRPIRFLRPIRFPRSISLNIILYPRRQPLIGTKFEDFFLERKKTAVGHISFAASSGYGSVAQ